MKVQLASLSALLLLAIGVHGETFTSASLLLRPAEYFGTTYTASPAEHSSYVYFPGEPIVIDVRIVNVGATPITLKTTATNPSEAFRAVRLDDGPVQVRFENNIVLQRRDTPLSVNWGEFGLLPREALLFRAVITGPTLAPGEYILEVDTWFTDDDGLRVKPQGSRFRFEIRASTPDSAAEQIWREANRAFRSGQYDLTEQWIGTLLRAHPRSYAAFVLRGRIAQAKADSRGARQAYQQALTILETNTDELFNRVVVPRTKVDTIAGLKRLATPQDR